MNPMDRASILPESACGASFLSVVFQSITVINHNPEDILVTLEQLAQLRDMLQTVKNRPKALAGVMGFFSQHMGDELDVLKLAQATSNPFVFSVLQTFASSLFPGPVVPNLILASLPNFHFFYGPFLVEGLFGMLIYFSEDVGKGLISMPSPHAPTEEQKYKLFTT